MNATEAARLRVGENITDLVGYTPLLHLRKIAPPGAADLYAKLEYLNPGGSVKDRAAIGIIRRAEEQGLLREGSTIVEATAGNTGVGLALIGVSRGYRVALFVPQKFSQEKVLLMRALGAEVTRTPDAEGMEGAIRRARELVASTPNSFLAGQFENLANPDYHYQTTAREIFEQMEGRIDAVVIGAGTGGTFTGVARFIKENVPGALAIAVEPQDRSWAADPRANTRSKASAPASCPRRSMEASPTRFSWFAIGRRLSTVGELARKEGVFSGSSGGANVYAAIEIAKRLGAGKRVVTMIPDSAERYLSKGIFDGI